jgi:5-methylcytosine-specific restriction enzyme A
VADLPLKPCLTPGCKGLARGRGRCERCAPAHARRVEHERGSSYQRGYNSTWRRLAKAFLRRHPFCVHCSRDGVLEMATVVDHIVPHKGDSKLFWDEENNWQGLCASHHSAKTAHEDGGFGNQTM